MVQPIIPKSNRSSFRESSPLSIFKKKSEELHTPEKKQDLKSLFKSNKKSLFDQGPIDSVFKAKLDRTPTFSDMQSKQPK